jgi:hypothetical protein
MQTAPELAPPWLEFPQIPWGSIGWRMGAGEDYWRKWLAWWKSDAQAAARLTYQSRWPEPPGWAGFYECTNSGAPPPWVIEERQKTEAAALPPQPGEETITERYRVKWLATAYFVKPKVPVRDPYERKLHQLLADPQGWLWKLHLPDSSDSEFRAPYFTRQLTEVIGGDNLPVKQPVA